MTEITSTHEIADAEWDGASEPQDHPEAMTATTESEGDGIEFHVQMRRYTKQAMDDLIVDAAARIIVGRHNDREIAKRIEAKCVELLNEKAAAALDAVTTDILDQPLTPSFGEKKPVTMREFLGLYGREYLTETVDHEGKPAKGRWGAGSVTSRMEWLVGRAIDRKFKNEIEKATGTAIREIQTATSARYKEMIAAEKVRFRKALANVPDPDT